MKGKSSAAANRSLIQSALEDAAREIAGRRYFFGGDFEILDRVNPRAGFWNGVLAALQASGFVALGRMYDRDNGVHTIHGLLDFTEKNRGLFQPAALEQRKAATGTSPENAKAFATGSFSLKRDGLVAIRDEFEEHRSLYANNVATPCRAIQQARESTYTPLRMQLRWWLG